MTCPLCSTRPARRRCPALQQEICPACCGAKRLVEIRCPDDCGYLASARRHPAAAVQRQHELDVALLLPAMAGFTDRQSRFFFLFQSIVLRHPGEVLRPLVDADVAQAASATAVTLETASRGVIYEQALASPNAQELAGAFSRAFDEIVQQVQGPRTPLERDAARALRGIEEAARRVGPIAGDARTGFLSLLRRMLGAPNAGAPAPRQQNQPSIILP
jgi:hypothetical protein